MNFSHALLFSIFISPTALPMDDSSYEQSSSFFEESLEYTEKNRDDKASKKRKHLKNYSQQTLEISRDKKTIKTEHPSLPLPLDLASDNDYCDMFTHEGYYNNSPFSNPPLSQKISFAPLEQPLQSPWLQQEMSKFSAYQHSSSKKNNILSSTSYHPLDFLKLNHTIFDTKPSPVDEKQDRAHKKYSFTLNLSNLLKKIHPKLTRSEEISYTNKEFLKKFQNYSSAEILIFFEKLQHYNPSLSYPEIYRAIEKTIEDVQEIYNPNLSIDPKIFAEKTF